MAEEVEPLSPDVFPSAERFFEIFTEAMGGADDAQLLPTMFYSAGQGLHIAALSGIGETMGAQEMLMRVLLKFRMDPGPADWIWFGHEGVGKIASKSALPPNPKPGDMQKAWEAGDPEIVEVVMLAGVHQDGAILALRPFKREGGEVVWADDLEIHELGPAEDAGGIIDVLRTGVR